MAKPTEFEEAIAKLERDLKQLQIEYDSYFAGGRKRAPAETEWRVQRAVKQLSQEKRMRYGERFRLNNLAQRYSKYSEIWRLRSGRVESGKSAFGYSKVARELEQQRLRDAEEQHEDYLHGDHSGGRAAGGRRARVGIGDVSKDGEAVQKLYKAMMESKKAAGEASNINYQQFHQFVQKKTEQLKQKMGVDRVEYRVAVENGKVTLKVKGG